VNRVAIAPGSVADASPPVGAILTLDDNARAHGGLSQAAAIIWSISTPCT
jgi:hypothetical protein